MKKILFITGTRADYGKIKSLISAIERSKDFEAYIFVSGMHLIKELGDTYQEIVKDQYKNIYIDFSQANRGIMSYDLGNVICNLTCYVKKVEPDMIIVHGDRIDALAGAVVGAMNNIMVGHIEGGELSGTIDESIRHAISKFAHIHLVCNEEAKNRLLQMGEESERIFIVGSPDIDIMLSDSLPTLDEVKKRYEISFDNYSVVMYHPVTTEFEQLPDKIEEFVDALIMSKRNYVVIYPNNDLGSELIMGEYRRFENNKNFSVFPSMRFEYFLTLLKNAEFMIGNSSAGIRETGVYGVPDIDVGTRQSGRYCLKGTNIQHVNENIEEILEAINKTNNYRIQTSMYGKGNSTDRFMQVLREENIWDLSIQKKFVDLSSTI